jgi:hypothetical protein
MAPTGNCNLSMGKAGCFSSKLRLLRKRHVRLGPPGFLHGGLFSWPHAEPCVFSDWHARLTLVSLICICASWICLVAKQIVSAAFGYDVQVDPADELLQMRHLCAVGQKVPASVSCPQRHESVVIDEYLRGARRV